MSLQVVTANRLDDGLVVFLTADGGWSENIDQSRIADGKEAGDALLAEASVPELDTVIVGPYLIEVEQQDGGLVPTKYREVLRTKGPSVRQDLGYQAG
ncbi:MULTISPECIES: DUF2849 domain-containing protein [Thalassospira]|jgi:sulfite reductase (NADPH) hemoprotein beta-component|uniref:Sulfite reductase (NADPH) hemoprotein beta-component n=1 Tax=Thalassospira xiamenensis TaxID=220697 RepID=A0A285TM58_9PROT|nr:MULTISPECIES: DUF2849 domain-containing protein [Thalassospira]UKV12856.1 DUF2849 domain-containing protein [Thalassospiraceae bacterium SW-3-3]MAZ32455.1 hypothetical protein [Thalassospira sp.]MCK2168907.1 DUF2849 domain-containing protein [Thalassospira xiamenensis]RCK32604.1 hypothetical protein TH9_12885 [Thalassospira xiamenensis]SOC23751.1 sulfite reductase (NADPH) hemoprotein beta-component [Thalassospira xiamenensis]